jgi:hypothetical protein
MTILLGILLAVVLVNTGLQVWTLRHMRQYARKLDTIANARQAFRDGTAQLRSRLDKRFGVRNGHNDQ